ncbi:hypothetical protein F2Q69_00009306 [Brassica cretica]|uniref:Uncharacterized protein n=1 Tax=Brassica cretica TaxID=69181 RepID=A0A8S9PET0_BRACR|nr:hypothetical protein F2Q69_00009306 [Brassica cretica]
MSVRIPLFSCSVIPLFHLPQPSHRRKLTSFSPGTTTSPLRRFCNGGEDPYAFIQTKHGNLLQDFGSSSGSQSKNKYATTTLEISSIKNEEI